MIEIRGAHNTAKVFIDQLEEGTYAQLLDLCNQEFVSGSKIRIMPDTHVGMGCTIGTTMTITDKVVPAHVGVDIGCGVYTVKIEDKDIDFAMLDKVIRDNVPAGFNVRAKPHAYSTKARLEELRCGKNLRNMGRLELAIGSLGGGNHFIEVGADSNGDNYLLIHTGSRNLGTQVAKIYQDLAAEKLGTKVSTNMAYLEGQDMKDYLHDMYITQDYADQNRLAIANVIMSGMNWTPIDGFMTVHNYIGPSGILRKGAVAAYAGQDLIIPINMRDGSILAVGKGNEDWNYSAPHGAGRVLSRGQAKRQLTMEDYEATMEGIYTTSVSRNTLDEAPMAYKPMAQILEAIGDTVDILDIIKPIYNFKAGGE